MFRRMQVNAKHFCPPGSKKFMLACLCFSLWKRHRGKNTMTGIAVKGKALQKPTLFANIKWLPLSMPPRNTQQETIE